MKVNKVIITLLMFVVSFFVFVILDVGINIEQMNQIVQPIFFSLSLTISILYTALRRYLLICSVVLLILLVVTYLLQMFYISNWLGSLGFGMLFITMFSYLPQLIRKGYIENF